MALRELPAKVLILAHRSAEDASDNPVARTRTQPQHCQMSATSDAMSDAPLTPACIGNALYHGALSGADVSGSRVRVRTTLVALQKLSMPSSKNDRQAIRARHLKASTTARSRRRDHARAGFRRHPQRASIVGIYGNFGHTTTRRQVSASSHGQDLGAELASRASAQTPSVGLIETRSFRRFRTRSSR